MCIDIFMEKFTGMDECKLTHNKVLGTPDLENTTIIFHGKGNILYCQNGVKIVNSTINFMQDHSVVFLCTNRGGYHLGVSINHNSVLFIGSNNYFNAKLNIVISEYQNVIIGNDGLYSFDCWLRTADPHLIYDMDTHKRINESRSIVIGDHVWIGQHVYILKGSMIGSGSIVGAGSVVSGKSLEEPGSLYAL